MPPRKRRIDANDVIDITPAGEVPDAPPGENLPAVTDEVALAVAALEEQAKSVAIDARKKDMAVVPVIDEVTDLILESLKNTKWDEVGEKDKAIVFGILSDKRSKRLDDIIPQRKQARKDANKSRTKFTFNFATQTAEVSVDDGDGGDE
jgi:hypothetical protein